jgi:hypothetical protein
MEKENGRISRAAQMTDIVELLATHADIFEGEEGELMRLADAEISRLRAINAELVAALERIAKNTCCDKCQEAALVARDALAKGTGEQA